MQGCQLRKKPCINHSGKFLTDQVFLQVEEIAYHVEEKKWCRNLGGRELKK